MRQYRKAINETIPKKMKTYGPSLASAIGKNFPTMKVQTQQITHPIPKPHKYPKKRLELTSAGSSSRLLEEFSGPDPWNRSGSDRETDDVAHDAQNRNVRHPSSNV